ncbi:M23 family metallopeptidase [Aeromonas veronii]|nr:M23 family metallopeptidase [Aeromonas veronii]
MKKTTIFLMISTLYGCASSDGGNQAGYSSIRMSRSTIEKDLRVINDNKGLSAFFEKKMFTLNKRDNFEKIFMDNGIPPSTLYKMKDSELAVLKNVSDGDAFIVTTSAKYNLFKIEKLRGDKIIFAKTMMGKFETRAEKKDIKIPGEQRVASESLYGFISSGDIVSDCSAYNCSSKANDLLELLDGHSEFDGFRRGDKLRFVVKKGKIEAMDFISKSNRIVVFWEGGDGEYVYFSDAVNKKRSRRVMDSDDPISPIYYSRISSRFNPSRYHPVLKKTRAHNGVDLAAKEGSPIMTVYQGRVSFIGVKGGYGKLMIIDHGKGLETAYGHMSRFNTKLKVGDYVNQGALIGYVGSTGLATGPHLHYEVRINKAPVDPTKVSLSSYFKMRGYYQERENVVITQNIKKLMTELNSIRIHN